MIIQIVKYFKHFAKVGLIFFVMIGFTSFLNDNTIELQNIETSRVKVFDTNYKPNSQPDTVKYILIWSAENEENDETLDILIESQTYFKVNKCEYDNCYVTRNKHLIYGGYRNFDAVVFNGKFLSERKNSYALPTDRNPEQQYIYAMRESADNFPVCDRKFDYYFNATWTYRLDSDAVWPYFIIYNSKGREIGPALDTYWVEQFVDDDEDEILDAKEFAATWFVSNCKTNSGREIVFLNIASELLSKYNITVDVVGDCGDRKCPKTSNNECMDNLKKYYFYFAFENSLSEFYLTDKILTAFMHDTVPIVYSGADYESLLPPGSFIDARKLTPDKVADQIYYLMNNQSAYLTYFRWRNHYSYGPPKSAMCQLCKLANKKTKSVYDGFRYWWNPDFRYTCRHMNKSFSKSQSEIVNFSVIKESLHKKKQVKFEDLKRNVSEFGVSTSDFEFTEMGTPFAVKRKVFKATTKFIPNLRFVPFKKTAPSVN